MSFPDGSRWALQYLDPKSDTRMLISLPSAMLEDIARVAESEGISMAELTRRALTERLAHSDLALNGKPRTRP